MMRKLAIAFLLLALIVPGASAARRGTGSNYMNFGSAASVDNLTKFTICVWIRFPNFTGTYSIVMKEQGAPYTNQKTFVYTDATMSGAWHIGLRNGGAFDEAKAKCVNSTLSANTWYHICSTYDNGDGVKKPKNYINGTEVTYDYQVAAGGSLNDDSAASFSAFGGASSGNYFSGDLHHLTVWSGVVLNQAEMMFHRAGGNPQPNSQVINVRMITGASGDELDWSASKNNGNAAGTFGTVVDVPPGWSLDFAR